eukprot:354416-Chlamydomonas_euryale.AAC.6
MKRAWAGYVSRRCNFRREQKSEREARVIKLCGMGVGRPVGGGGLPTPEPPPSHEHAHLGHETVHVACPHLHSRCAERCDVATRVTDDDLRRTVIVNVHHQRLALDLAHLETDKQRVGMGWVDMSRCVNDHDLRLAAALPLRGWTV